MPRKSRHGRRKKLPPVGKAKGIPVSPAVSISREEAAGQPGKPVAPSAGAPAVTLARYPYVGAELRRIGILAGIILVILVLLSIILP